MHKVYGEAIPRPFYEKSLVFTTAGILEIVIES